MFQRRATQRYSVHIATVIEFAGERRAGMLVDLSLGGALVVAQRAEFKLGDRPRLEFTVYRTELIDCHAIVRWRALNGIGVLFDGLRAREVWALTKHFADVEAI